MTSIKAAPLCWIAALISGTSCILSPEKLRATKEAPSCSAIATRSIGESVLTAPRRALEPLSAGAQKLALVNAHTPVFSSAWTTYTPRRREGADCPRPDQGGKPPPH